MIKKSFLNISFVGAGHFFNAALGLLFIAAVAKVLSLEDFGKYALISSLLVFTAKLTDFGTNSLFVAKSISEGKKGLSNVLYSIKVLSFFVALAVSLIILFIFKLNTIPLLIIFVLGLIAYEINFTLYALFQKLEEYPLLILTNTLIAGIKGFFAILIFAKLYDPTLTEAFAIFAFSVYPSLLLFKFIPKELRKFKFSIDGVKDFLMQSYPAGISQIISEGWSALNNSIVKLAQNFANVGIYSLADKISSIFTLISVSIFAVLLPKNARRKRQKLDYDFNEALIISVGIMILAVLAIIIAQFLVVKVFGDKFAGSVAILDILIFASAITSINTFMENYFFVEGKTKYLMFLSLSRLFLLLVLALILMPRYALSGLAYAQLITNALILISIFTIVTRSISSKSEKDSS